MTPIPICMPIYNRPQFLVQVLSALRGCEDLQRFMILTSEEPGCSETQQLLDRQLPSMGIPYQRYVNEERLGCAKNVERSLERGFATGADIVISLEDDVLLARDALQWLMWAAATYRYEPRILAAAAWSKQTEEYQPCIGDLSQTLLSSQFIAWGYAVNRDRFSEYRFVFDEAVRNKWAWDMTTTMYMPGNQCMVVFPKVSRAQNIGCIGNGVADKEFWMKNHFVYNYIGDTWSDYPKVVYQPVTDQERRENDRACLLNKPEGKVPFITQRI